MHKCEKCGHESHCNVECMRCVNDICTGCKCQKCVPKEKYNE